MSKHEERLRETAAQLSSERIQGWANPFVVYCTEAADHITALQAKVARLEAALEELSCRHVTEGPLWWQSIARNALRAISLDTTTAPCDNTREGE